MSMNRFYSLPDDIIECIYKFEHSLNFNSVLCKIKYCRNPDFDTFIYKEFFNSPTTNKEVQDFYLFSVWSVLIIDRELEDFPTNMIEKVQNSKYINLFTDFWNDTVDYDPHYVPGDYI